MAKVEIKMGEIGGGGGGTVNYDTSGMTATTISMSSNVEFTAPNDGIWEISFKQTGTVNVYINNVTVSSGAIYDNNTTYTSKFIVQSGDKLKFVIANITTVTSNTLYS